MTFLLITFNWWNKLCGNFDCDNELWVILHIVHFESKLVMLCSFPPIVVASTFNMARRPRSTVAAVVVHNDEDTHGNWIPMKLEMGSWVTLKAGSHGAWARDAKAHGSETYGGAYKGKIVSFQFKATSIDGRESTSRPPILERILVRHAYMHRQLVLDPNVVQTEPRHCNCELVPTTFFLS